MSDQPLGGLLVADFSRVCEGTSEMHTLVIGQALTGHAAFRH